MKSFNEYFRLLADQIAEYYAIDRVAEFKPPLQPLDERLIQCVWAEQLLDRPNLKSLDGSPLEVVNPGDWNTGHGPDFQDAEIIIDGVRRRGDVEVHLRSNDFRGHGHDRDFEYNNVILHVFLSQTDRLRHETLHNGSQVQRLEIEPLLFPDLDTIRATINPDEFPNAGSERVGKCHPIFADWSFDELKDFLNAAGRKRLERKTERLANQRCGESLDQVFYQALMVTMGLRGSKPLYFLLAKRTPVEELRDYIQDVDPADRIALLESIYFHVANWIPEPEKRDALSDEEKEWLERRETLWKKVEPYFSDRIIPRTKRWISGVRPVNFAPRRFSGIARWLAPRLQQRGIVGAMKDEFKSSFPQVLNKKEVRRWVKLWTQRFIIDDQSFWAWRYNWGGKTTTKPMTLIGETQARSIILNGLLPMLLLIAGEQQDAELEDQVFRMWGAYPPLPPNRIVQRMRNRLFNEHPQIDSLLKNEQRQQALYQVFHEFCNNEMLSCEQCVFFMNQSEKIPPFYRVEE